MKSTVRQTLKTAISATVIVLLFLFAKCRKEEPLPDYYIRCKIDGQDYWPDKCANCMRGQLLGDTVFLMNANAGFQTVLLGVTQKPSFLGGSYVLSSPSSGAAYKNSTTTNDRFDTDSTHKGQLIFTTLDKANKTITGTFFFQAFNPVQNKVVSITNGQFRLKYTIN